MLPRELIHSRLIRASRRTLCSPVIFDLLLKGTARFEDAFAPGAKLCTLCYEPDSIRARDTRENDNCESTNTLQSSRIANWNARRVLYVKQINSIAESSGNQTQFYITESTLLLLFYHKAKRSKGRGGEWSLARSSLNCLRQLSEFRVAVSFFVEILSFSFRELRIFIGE